MALPKKCAIIADGDLKPSDYEDIKDEEDSFPAPPDLDSLASEYVGVFRCKTTFERALTKPGLLLCLSSAAKECGATNVAKKLEAGYKKIKSEKLAEKEKKELETDLGNTVLATAKRVGKARFAQVVSKHMDSAEAIPKYIRDAIEWLEL